MELTAERSAYVAAGLLLVELVATVILASTGWSSIGWVMLLLLGSALGVVVVAGRSITRALSGSAVVDLTVATLRGLYASAILIGAFTFSASILSTGNPWRDMLTIVALALSIAAVVYFHRSARAVAAG